MKFVSFAYQQGEEIGILTPRGVVPIELVFPPAKKMTMTEFIAKSTEKDIDQLKEAVKNDSLPALPVESVRILPPIRRPVHDIICVGVNYKDHLTETQRGFDKGFGAPDLPVFFSKRASVLCGSGDKVRGRLDLDRDLDYEVELAVIIGRRGRDIPVEMTFSYIFGYSIFNDFSSRGLQQAHVQWFKGKSLDGYAAMGPHIIHRDSLPYPPELEITCSVNGELRQRSNTRLLVHSIGKLIALASDGMTLEPGDIIATGTPSGVGLGFNPPRFLGRGDSVCCEIENIGRLENTIE